MGAWLLGAWLCACVRARACVGAWVCIPTLEVCIPDARRSRAPEEVGYKAAHHGVGLFDASLDAPAGEQLLASSPPMRLSMSPPRRPSGIAGSAAGR